MAGRFWYKRSLILYAALGIVVNSGIAVAQERPTIDPSAEEVGRIIEELPSVRDYERLYWILDGIERQVPSLRAELLGKLDDRVQRLLQADAEARIATAVQGLTPALSVPVLTQQGVLSGSTLPHTTGGPDLLQQTRSTGSAAKKVDAQNYEDVRRTIETASLDGNAQDSGVRMQELMRAVMGVQDRTQRAELRQLLRDRYQQAFQARMQQPQGQP